MHGTRGFLVLGVGRGGLVLGGGFGGLKVDVGVEIGVEVEGLGVDGEGVAEGGGDMLGWELEEFFGGVGLDVGDDVLFFGCEEGEDGEPAGVELGFWGGCGRGVGIGLVCVGGGDGGCGLD